MQHGRNRKSKALTVALVAAALAARATQAAVQTDARHQALVDRTQVQVDARHQALLRHGEQAAPFVYVTTKPETRAGDGMGLGRHRCRCRVGSDRPRLCRGVRGPQEAPQRLILSAAPLGAALPGAPGPRARRSIPDRLSVELDDWHRLADGRGREGLVRRGHVVERKTPSRTSYPAAPASSRSVALVTPARIPSSSAGVYSTSSSRHQMFVTGHSRTMSPEPRKDRVVGAAPLRLGLGGHVHGVARRLHSSEEPRRARAQLGRARAGMGDELDAASRTSSSPREACSPSRPRGVPAPSARA